MGVDFNKLKEERATLVTSANLIYEGTEGRQLTAEESEQVEKLLAQADDLKEQIQAEEDSQRKKRTQDAFESLRASQRRVNPSTMPRSTVSDSERKHAIRAWALQGTEFSRSDARTLETAHNAGVNLSSANLNVRALSKGTSTAGGHTVPVNLVTEIEKALKFYNPIRGIGGIRTLVTDTGADLDYPRVSDIANVASIVAEAGTIATNVDPTFDKITMKAWKYASPIVLVSVELLQDSSVDIEALLGDLLGERMARGQAAHMVTGTSTTQPQGVLSGASVGVNLATGNPVTFDKILDLIHSVDPAYRQNASFLMNDDLASAIRKLKDGENRYLWEISTQVGMPDRLFGYPVIISNDCPSYVTGGDNVKLAAFGSLSHYLIRDVGPSLTVARLSELYAATGSVGFVLLQRTDARYIGHSGCVKTLNTFDEA